MSKRNPYSSPCNNVCILRDGYCVSCNRSMNEIMNWIHYDQTERIDILKDLKSRNNRD